MLNRWVIVSILLIGIVTGAMALVSGFRAVGNNQGYEPNQPIAFSHKMHAGDNQISCLYCHSGAERSRHAGIPAASTCMNCHKIVRKDSPEVAKITAALAKNEPIVWTKVHRLADFVAFSHQVHVASGKVSCQSCHGPVEQMARMRQENNMTMGWCMDCHRKSEVIVHPMDVSKMPDPRRQKVAEAGGIDCAKCHY